MLVPKAQVTDGSVTRVWPTHLSGLSKPEKLQDELVVLKGKVGLSSLCFRVHCVDV